MCVYVKTYVYVTYVYVDIKFAILILSLEFQTICMCYVLRLCDNLDKSIIEIISLLSS